MGGIENVCMVKEGAHEEGQTEVWAAKEMEKMYKHKVCREGRVAGRTVIREEKQGGWARCGNSDAEEELVKKKVREEAKEAQECATYERGKERMPKRAHRERAQCTCQKRRGRRGGDGNWEEQQGRLRERHSMARVKSDT